MEPENLAPKDIEKYTEANSLMKKAEKVEINSEEDIAKVSPLISSIKRDSKILEGRRTEITKPMNESLRNINKMFRTVSTVLTGAEQGIKTKILGWVNSEEERIEKAEKKGRALQKAHKDKGHNVKDPVYIERPDRTFGNIQIRRVLTFQVTDPNKVPKNFYSVDEGAIKTAIAEGARDIPGVTLGHQNQIAVTTK